MSRRRAGVATRLFLAALLCHIVYAARIPLLHATTRSLHAELQGPTLGGSEPLAPPGLFSPARGNLMFWKTHKVGGTTLRHVLLRRVARHNLTLGQFGCGRQREPLHAHLSAGHVVCKERSRDKALAALLGKNYSEVVLVRDPVDRALSAYYFIIMSRRRTDAVNAAGCGFNLTFAGRQFDGESAADRQAFARHGYAALSSCALHHTGGAAAHVRVFQPQWSYWAATPAISKAHVMHRYTEGGFFVGRTERFDESLVLLAYWLGFHPVSDMWYSSRKRLYGSGHPKSNDWAASDIEALRAVTDASGERLWHAAMCALYERQLAAVGNATSAQVARDVGLLQTHNARELSPEEVEAERLLKKLRHRPVAKKFVL